MGRRLWLLRHAKAHKEPPAGGGDRQRRLSPQGIEDLAELRGVLEAGALGVALPERVLFSEAARTDETARLAFDGLVADCWGDARLYAAGPDEVLDVVAELPDELGSVAIVGHNPTIHALSLELAAVDGPHPFAERYRPGELCVLEAEATAWSRLGPGDFRLAACWRLSRP
jgi:phosphohistidine phosphatase